MPGMNGDFCPKCGKTAEFNDDGKIECPHCGWREGRIFEYGKSMRFIGNPKVKMVT